MSKAYIVRNYHSFISVPSEDEKKPIVFESGDFNELIPFTKKLTYEQIEFINLRSDLFKIGRLEFEEKDEHELFEKLDINKDKVFKASEIVDIVRFPTKGKLERIVSIDDMNIIDLFRGIMVSIKNLGNEDISNRVIATIDKRRDELYRGNVHNSSIIVKKTKEEEQREADMVKQKQLIEEAVAKAKLEWEAEQSKEKKVTKQSPNKKVDE